MICPPLSESDALRLPFTATFVTIPSLAALPPNMFIMRPSMPSNLTRPFSWVLTSARIDGPRVRHAPSATTSATEKRFMQPTSGERFSLTQRGHSCRADPSGPPASAGLEGPPYRSRYRPSFAVVNDRHQCSVLLY